LFLRSQRGWSVGSLGPAVLQVHAAQGLPVCGELSWLGVQPRHLDRVSPHNGKPRDPSGSPNAGRAGAARRWAANVALALRLMMSADARGLLCPIVGVEFEQYQDRGYTELALKNSGLWTPSPATGTPRNARTPLIAWSVDACESASSTPTIRSPGPRRQFGTGPTGFTAWRAQLLPVSMPDLGRKGVVHGKRRPALRPIARAMLAAITENM